jgi:NADPH:quinone reductase-like Zn-dependent oxidoreductase
VDLNLTVTFSKERPLTVCQTSQKFELIRRQAMGKILATEGGAARQLMKAVCVHHFGGPEAIVYEEVPLPVPGEEQVLRDMDVVIDTVGGETIDSSFEVLKPGGVLVSSVAQPDQDKAAQYQVRGEFLLVTVTSECLARIAELLDSGHLATNVGEVLPLTEARLAHEMLAGKPHKRGKIVLAVDS